MPVSASSARAEAEARRADEGERHPSHRIRGLRIATVVDNAARHRNDALVSDALVLVLKIVLSIAAIGAFGEGVRVRLGARRELGILGLLAALAVLAYANFGNYHRPRGFVHVWEQTHYVMGSKYFAEIGYDDFYVALVQGVRDARPSFATPPIARDLRTGRLVWISDVLARGPDVASRFPRERYRAFLHDLSVFADALGPGGFASLVRDHGFNPPPSWIAVAQAIERVVPVTPASLVVFGLVDPFLYLVLFAVLARTFGIRPALACVVVFGLGHPWSGLWTSGAFLRSDWLVAVGLGVCALRTERFALAGLCLGYAAIVRLFPAAFVAMAAAPLAFASVRDPSARRSLLALLAGFALACAAFAFAGSRVGRGPAAWSEFAARIHTHEGQWSTNHVGLETLLVVDAGIRHRRLERVGDAYMPWEDWSRAMEVTRAERGPYFRALGVALALVLAFALRRAAPWRSAIVGVVAIFGFTPLSSYYWAMVLLVPLAAPRRVTRWLLAVTPIAGVTELAVHMYSVTFAVASFAMLLAFGVWARSIAAGEAEAAPY